MRAELQPSLIRQIHALKRPSSLDLSLGEPTLRIDPELWARGLARHEREPRGYSPNLGMPALREAIAAYHGVKADNVIVTVGSEEALFLAFFTLLDPGDEVIIPELAYPAYAGLATMVGATAVRVPMKDYALDGDAVQAAVTPKTKFAIVSSPSNPFGRIDSVAEREKIKVPVLSDEIYRELWFRTPPPTGGDIVVGGLSKSCAMTGDRLGWLIADAEVVQRMWPVHQLTVTCASTLAQQLALEAFLEPRFLTAHRQTYADQWTRAKACLDKYEISYIEPDGAFYAMCAIVPSGEDSFDFCKRVLKESDVVLVPGLAFGPSGNRLIRLSFAGDPETFAQAIQRVKALIDSVSKI